MTSNDSAPVIGIGSGHRERIAAGRDLDPGKLAEGQKRMEEYLKKTDYETNTVQKDNINGMMHMEVRGCSYENGSLTLAYPLQPWQGNRAGMLHGGIICTAFDIAMGAAARFYAGENYAPTLELDVKYIRPVKIGDTLLVTVFAQASGRTITHLRAEAVSERTGKLAAAAAAIFMSQDSRKGR